MNTDVIDSRTAMPSSVRLLPDLRRWRLDAQRWAGTLVSAAPLAGRA